MRSLFALLLALWCGHGKAADPERWSVRVDVQMVAIDAKLAITLIPELQSAETADRAIEKIRAMIEDEKADLLAWPCATAALGQRVVSEGGEELRYPEYGHGHVGGPQSFGWVPPLLRRRSLPYYFIQDQQGYTATAFENRRLGPVLEFEPVVDETGGNITLSISTGAVDFERFKEFREHPPRAKIAGTMVVAEFRSRTVYSSLVTVKHKKRILLTSFVEQRPKPRVVLYLLRAQMVGEKPISHK